MAKIANQYGGCVRENGSNCMQVNVNMIGHNTSSANQLFHTCSSNNLI